MPPCPPPRRLRALRRDDSAPMWRRPPPPLPRRKLGRRITHAPWRGVRGVGDVDASAWKHQHLGTDAAPTGPKSGDCTCVSRGAAATPVEGSSPQVTFVEAPGQLMPGFDPENGKLAQRILINPRKIDYHTGVFARKITPAKDGKPVLIELIDAKTKEHKETLEVDAALIAPGRAPFTKGLGLENINVVTQRGFVPVDEQMQVMDADGSVVC